MLLRADSQKLVASRSSTRKKNPSRGLHPLTDLAEQMGLSRTCRTPHHHTQRAGLPVRARHRRRPPSPASSALSLKPGTCSAPWECHRSSAVGAHDSRKELEGLPFARIHHVSIAIRCLAWSPIVTAAAWSSAVNVFWFSSGMRLTPGMRYILVSAASRSDLRHVGQFGAQSHQVHPTTRAGRQPHVCGAHLAPRARRPTRRARPPRSRHPAGRTRRRAPGPLDRSSGAARAARCIAPCPGPMTAPAPRRRRSPRTVAQPRSVSSSSIAGLSPSTSMSPSRSDAPASACPAWAPSTASSGLRTGRASAIRTSSTACWVPVSSSGSTLTPDSLRRVSSAIAGFR